MTMLVKVLKTQSKDHCCCISYLSSILNFIAAKKSY